MPNPFSAADFKVASERFRGFFEELSRAFVERDDLLAQIGLALLSREHVLMTGPPGTAKSGIASAVLGRIVDERTGEPSVFARQFTESTVQTDLVGPIDFKTLMQTGHTEHFTDEGMLGAVHAFLDEVLDGRDMLLRTTLNVLQERELKQGTKTTHGRIECALMTTNRYLAEVLEGSRETLLAFVDRVAFVSFVPKGFVSPESLCRVLRAQVGGGARRGLAATLTIQDLDVLQAAADATIVPDDVCDALARLIDQLDEDFAAAAKSDPSFVPSRYLSTRTAVRLACILRAACVHDVVMNGATRELVVEGRDLATLRLSLLLSGPDYASVGKLLERETDPRERRQLSILRTERDLFERALARVPKPERRSIRSRSPGVVALDAVVAQAPAGASTTRLLDTAAKLAEVADGGGATAPAAAELLATTLERLAGRALRVGATAGAGPEERAVDIVPELASLADGLEAASGSTRPVARWLRGRAIQTLLDAAALSGAFVGESLDAVLPAEPSIDDCAKQSERALAHLESMLDVCARLRARGADEPPQHSFDGAIERAVARVEEELVEIWDTGFRDSVEAALARVGAEELGPLLIAFEPTLAQIDRFGARLGKLGSRGASLKARVVGPRIEPLVRAAFERLEARDRLSLVEQVGNLVGALDRAGLKGVLAPSALLCFAASALVRAEGDGRPSRATPTSTAGHAGYRALRESAPRVSLAYAVVELALRVAPERAAATASPQEILGAVGGTIAAIPEALRARIVELDLARIDRAVGALSAWWASLDATSAPESTDAASRGRALANLAESRFFHVTRDEGALLRFALEARVVGDVFPEANERVATLRDRIAQLEADSSRALNTLRRERADARWQAILDAGSTRA